MLPAQRQRMNVLPRLLRLRQRLDHLKALLHAQADLWVFGCVRMTVLPTVIGAGTAANWRQQDIAAVMSGPT